MLLLAMLTACESESEKHEREWKESFGPLVAKYEAMELAGENEMDPALVRGRKVLSDNYPPSLYESRESWEAATVEEVGLVIVDHTVSDPEPSAEYEGGAKGYGGTVTEAAFAHPEGKRVYSLTWHCSAPYYAFGTQNLKYGTKQVSDAHCYGDKASRMRAAGPLVDAVPVDGSNTNAAGTAAYVALAEAQSAHLSEPVAVAPPSLVGRKVLFMTRNVKGEGEVPAWRPWLNEAYVDPAWTTKNADEAGLVAYSTTTWENAPSRHYECGVLGYAGTEEVVVVAVPEGVVVSRSNPECVLPDEESAARLADISPERRCGAQPAAIKALLAGLVGG